MKKTLQTLFTLAIILISYTAQAQIRLVAVDPGTGIITLQNFGSSNVDVSGYRFCHKFNYSNTVASMTAFSGDKVNFAPGLLILTGAVGIDAVSSDLSLYLPAGAFSDQNAMVDFVQWGSGGNGRESVAVAKGIWTAGDFITGASPYAYTGNGSTDVGLPFWQTPTSIEEKDISKEISVYPNPVKNIITVNVGTLDVNSVKILNVLGEVVLAKEVSSQSNTLTIDLSDFPNGNYTLRINAKEGVTTKKIIVVK